MLNEETSKKIHSILSDYWFGATDRVATYSSIWETLMKESKWKGDGERCMKVSSLILANGPQWMYLA